MKKTISAMLSMCLCCSFLLVGNANAVSSNMGNCLEIDLIAGEVKSAFVPDVNATGSNLVSGVEQAERALTRAVAIQVQTATYKDEAVTITGDVNGTPFAVSGEFCSVSDNENVVVFNATDKMGNFNVAYCAVERDIQDSGLYFKSITDGITQSTDTVTKLYLQDKTATNTRDFTIIEILGNEFPEISQESISELPANHQLNLFWYAKIFAPVEKGVEEGTATTRAGNPNFTLLGYWYYNPYGMWYKHYVRYEQSCDIRDVTRNQASNASANIKVTQKWVEAQNPNDSSSNTSMLSLSDIDITYKTMKYTAVQTQMASGQVKTALSISTKFNYGIKLAYDGLTIAPSLIVNITHGQDNWSTGAIYEPHTNTDGNYWRAAQASLPHGSGKLANVNHYFNVQWTYGAYTNSTYSDDAIIVFDYIIDNELDYTESQHRTDTRTIRVNIT